MLFLVSGSLPAFSSLFSDAWAAVAIVAVRLVVARPGAILRSLVGAGPERQGDDIHGQASP